MYIYKELRNKLKVTGIELQKTQILLLEKVPRLKLIEESLYCPQGQGTLH